MPKGCRHDQTLMQDECDCLESDMSVPFTEVQSALDNGLMGVVQAKLNAEKATREENYKRRKAEEQVEDLKAYRDRLIARLHEASNGLKASVTKTEHLREVLSFYADLANYSEGQPGEWETTGDAESFNYGTPYGTPEFEPDCGDKARAALEKK